MHLAERINLTIPYVARPYRGSEDHPAMTKVLAAYRQHIGNPELPTVEELDAAYAHLTGRDPDADIALIETVGEAVIAYCRASWTDLESGGRDCVVFNPISPEHLAEPLFRLLTEAQERHMRPSADAVDNARYRVFAVHPGSGKAPTDEAAWLQAMDYSVTEWAAFLLRPNLEDIPVRLLPEGVEVRRVEPEQVRTIWEAHWEAFRGEWDFNEAERSECVIGVCHRSVSGTLRTPHTAAPSSVSIRCRSFARSASANARPTWAVLKVAAAFASTSGRHRANKFTSTARCGARNSPLSKP